MATIIISLAAQVLPEDSRFHKLFWLPIAMMLIDFGENIGIVSMLNSHPEQSVAVAQITNIFTMLKWISFGASLLSILVLFGMWLTRRGKA
jgi:hypothetical protein